MSCVKFFIFAHSMHVHLLCTQAWNFNQWRGVVASPSSDMYLPKIRDTWAETVSPNPNVKVYIGAPASSSAAASGYVSASTFAAIIQEMQSQYSSFGGVMLWDASQAYGAFGTSMRTHEMVGG
jgi:chitinase